LVREGSETNNSKFKNEVILDRQNLKKKKRKKKRENNHQISIFFGSSR
jgi:hypothetical protein